MSQTSDVLTARLTDALKQLQTLADDKSLTDLQKANVLAAAARSNGVSEAEIAAAWGGSAAVVRQFFQNAGIPQFAVGTNYVPRDGLAMLHKGEAVVPVAYNPAAGGSSNGTARLEALVEKLTACTWDKPSIAAAIKEVLAACSIKMPQLAMPVRVLVMGTAQTPSLDAVLELSEREKVLTRLHIA